MDICIMQNYFHFGNWHICSYFYIWQCLSCHTDVKTLCTCTVLMMAYTIGAPVAKWFYCWPTDLAGTRSIPSGSWNRFNSKRLPLQRMPFIITLPSSWYDWKLLKLIQDWKSPIHLLYGLRKIKAFVLFCKIRSNLWTSFPLGPVCPLKTCEKYCATASSVNLSLRYGKIASWRAITPEKLS